MGGGQKTMEETRNASSVYCVSQDDRNIMLKVSSPSMDDDTFSHLLNMEFNPFMAHLMEGEEEGFVPPLNNLAPPLVRQCCTENYFHHFRLYFLQCKNQILFMLARKMTISSTFLIQQVF